MSEVGGIVDNSNSLGMKLQEIRKRKNLTAEQVAEMTDISEGFLRKIEAGAKEPSLETFIALCKVLSADVDDVLASQLQIKRIENRDDLASKVSKEELSDYQLLLIKELIKLLKQ